MDRCEGRSGLNERRSDQEWVESSFHVNGRRIGVSVRRLDEAEANRLGASLAWFASGILSAERVDSGWPATMQYIFHNYIALTMEEQAVKDLDQGPVSTAVCAGALTAFIRANRLDASISRHFAPYLQRDDAVEAFIH